jgi:hypothetical protein
VLAAPQRKSSASPPPRPEDLVQAVLTISEGLPCPDRYLRGLIALVGCEYVRRLRYRRRAA